MLFVEKPPQSVRGSLISNRVDYSRNVDLDWKEVLIAIPEAAKNDLKKLIKGDYPVDEFFATPDHLKRAVSGVGWYSASLYNGITTAIMYLMHKKKNIPFEETCRQMGRYSAESHLSGFTAYVLQVASIAQVVNLVIRGWKGYYSEGEISVTKNVPGEAEFIANLNYVLPEMRFAMAGYFEITLERKGAKNVKVASNYLPDNGGTFKFKLTWSV